MEDKYDSLALKNQLCFPIYLCSKEIIRKYTPLLNELDLTYTQYIVMMYLWEKKVSNVKDISKSLLLDSGTLTPLLKKLEKKGYIKRIRSNIDERILNVSISEKGMSLKKRALSIPEKMKDCINISEGDAKILYTIIYKILVNTQKEE